MRNKQGKLEVLLHKHMYDIVAITKTLGAETPDWNILLEGYKLFKRNTPNERGGGIALYVTNHYMSTEMN